MIEVINSGYFMTIQDCGRNGYRRFGVPVSGALDWFAFLTSNMLVNNPSSAACLEIGMPGCELRAQGNLLVAVTGNGYGVTIDDVSIPLWTSIYVRQGQIIRISCVSAGGWAYLSVHGGIQVKPILGSKSTYPRGKLGGFADGYIHDGDTLLVGAGFAENPYQFVGRQLVSDARLPYSKHPELRVIPGPQFDRIDYKSQEGFLSTNYQITLNSDRMGFRLMGQAIHFEKKGELLSEGMVPGSIQVPADGQPIVMMCDSPTTGGYPKIAVVISADLPLLAQAVPGVSQVAFRVVSLQAAQMLYRQRKQSIENMIKDGCQGDEELCVSI